LENNMSIDRLWLSEAQRIHSELIAECNRQIDFARHVKTALTQYGAEAVRDLPAPVQEQIEKQFSELRPDEWRRAMEEKADQCWNELRAEVASLLPES
jgi:hypothetical protein